MKKNAHQMIVGGFSSGAGVCATDYGAYQNNYH